MLTMRAFSEQAEARRQKNKEVRKKRDERAVLKKNELLTKLAGEAPKTAAQ